MILHVQRFCPDNPQGGQLVAYDVPLENATLLEMLEFIKTKMDPTLSFAHECRSNVCGSCAMRVNGHEVLACSYKPCDNDNVEPLKNMPLLRDLVVDMDAALTCNAKAHAYGSVSEKLISVTSKEAHQNALQSDCILCGSCYSACPVLAVNENFLGPFALTRNWRYVTDVREQNIADKIEAVQKEGIWDCTLCNECVPVCPQEIAPKQDILMLRSKSGMMGYMDPNLFGGGGFGGAPDFGGPVF